MSPKVPVGVLGATGLVGQRFLALICNHPVFYVAKLGASSSSAGSAFGSVCKWKLATQIDPQLESLTIVECLPENFAECKWIFSALDSTVAGPIELEFSKHGLYVFTNASNNRMDPKVPLVVPTANPHHLGVLDPTKGYIVANPNCTASGIAVVLAAIQKCYPVDACIIHTMQAVSGAGTTPGCSAIDILDNIIPFIGDEEEKLETELPKILENGQMRLSASCNRVAVQDGHSVSISIKLSQTSHSKDQLALKISRLLGDFNPRPTSDLLPTWPKKVIQVHEENNRPQPRLDRDLGDGMTVSVGRIRPCAVLDIKMTILSHNTILGAAGSSLLNAELAYAMKLLY